MREYFDTGVAKIRTEIKTRLVSHGLFGSFVPVDSGPVDPVPVGVTIQVTVKGRTVERYFDRRQAEDCRLKVGGTVLTELISMVDELSA